jgi:hypothetical protein
VITDGVSHIPTLLTDFQVIFLNVRESFKYQAQEYDPDKDPTPAVPAKSRRMNKQRKQTHDQFFPLTSEYDDENGQSKRQSTQGDGSSRSYQGGQAANDDETGLLLQCQL